MTVEPQATPPPGRHSGQVAVACGIAVLGAFVLWAAGEIPPGAASHSKVGPRVVPYIAGAAILMVGLILLWTAWRGGWAVEDDGSRIDGPADQVDWRAMAWFATGLLVNVLLIGHLGFIIAATTLFFCIARAFGSQRPLRDLGIGLAIAVVAYIGFDRLLGISLGLGTLWGGG
jgi:putative tricarboxylic transport membrane protein